MPNKGLVLAETLLVLLALLSLLLQYSTASLTSLTTARMALPATAVPRWNRVARCTQHIPVMKNAEFVFSGEPGLGFRGAGGA